MLNYEQGLTYSSSRKNYFKQITFFSVVNLAISDCFTKLNTVCGLKIPKFLWPYGSNSSPKLALSNPNYLLPLHWNHVIIKRTRSKCSRFWYHNKNVNHGDQHFKAKKSTRNGNNLLVLPVRKLWLEVCLYFHVVFGDNLYKSMGHIWLARHYITPS